MPKPIVLTVTPTLITSAYTANTTLGGRQILRPVPSSGIIRDVTLYIDGTITPALDIYFFDQQPTDILDNVAFTQSHAEQQKRLTGGKISIAAGEWITENSKTRVEKLAVNRDYAASAVADYGYALWFFLSPTATPTFPSASALKVEVTLW